MNMYLAPLAHELAPVEDGQRLGVLHPNAEGRLGRVFLGLHGFGRGVLQIVGLAVDALRVLAHLRAGVRQRAADLQGPGLELRLLSGWQIPVMGKE